VADISLMADNLRLSNGIGEEAAPIIHLVIRAQAGDREAFDQLMICHERKIVALAWRMLGNREEARDAAQETFLRVYRHLGKFDPDRDVSAWLYRIAVNVCRDFGRKRNHRESPADDEAINRRPSAEDIEGNAIVAQEKRLVLQALAELSEKERAAIVLRDLEGFETDEVARLLGSSPTTVRSQISKARMKLKIFRDRWTQNKPRNQSKKSLGGH
jgi:RNA polymerase sigma-70 factor (ECF subfamily)